MSWSRRPGLRVAVVVAIALSVPTNVLMSYAFVRQPPRWQPEPAMEKLCDWIRQRTPTDAVFVQPALRAPQGASLAQRLAADRHWLDIPVFAARRRFLGYNTYVLSRQWGHVELDHRQRVAETLVAGEALRRWKRVYLRRLGSPVYVVVSTAIRDATRFDPAVYALAYDRDGYRVYRLVL